MIIRAGRSSSVTCGKSAVPHLGWSGGGRPGPGDPPCPALPQGDLERDPQRATRLQVQTLVNGLVRNTHLRVIGMVGLQPLADLLG